MLVNTLMHTYEINEDDAFVMAQLHIFHDTFVFCNGDYARSICQLNKWYKNINILILGFKEKKPD